MTGIEYIEQQVQETKRRMDAWILKAYKIEEKDIPVLEESLKLLNNDEAVVKSLIRNQQDTMLPQQKFTEVLIQMAASLKDDLSVYTNQKYDETLNKIGLGLLESGTIHAGCVRVNDYGKLLDGYGIFINIGTYYALQLIAKNMIIENFQDDFLQYQREAPEFLDLAADIYFTQDSDLTKEIFFYDYPKEVQAEAGAAQSSVAIKVLQFIALHELGHIINGDFEVMGFHARFMHEKDGQTDLPDTVDIQQSHYEEYAADMFALNALFDNEISPLSKWSSFYPIYFFLVWLDAIEQKVGKKLSNLHPNSISRAKRLEKQLLELTDGEDYGYLKHLENIILKLKQWSEQ